jgi:hypothetical protein
LLVALQWVTSQTVASQVIDVSASVDAGFWGWKVSARGDVMLDSMSNDNAVTYTAWLYKREQAPRNPPEFPKLTSQALSVLKHQGPEKFEEAYGKYFVYGFQRGTHAVMTYSLHANEKMSKKEIIASLNVNNANIADISTESIYTESMKNNAVTSEAKFVSNANVICGSASTLEEAKRCMDMADSELLKQGMFCQSSQSSISVDVYA